MRGPFNLVPHHPNLIKKFEDGLRKAISQRDQQGSGKLVVFFGLETIDAKTNETIAKQAIKDWAEEARTTCDARIVISYMDGWSTPMFDTGTA